jgi:hypothetical protein
MAPTPPFAQLTCLPAFFRCSKTFFQRFQPPGNGPHPEQAQGKPADARSEIFSFGLVLYEMLAGCRAFSGDTALTIMAARLSNSPPLWFYEGKCQEKIFPRRAEAGREFVLAFSPTRALCLVRCDVAAPCNRRRLVRADMFRC